MGETSRQKTERGNNKLGTRKDTAEWTREGLKENRMVC